MILCKDRESYDALMALCDEFPDSMGNIKEKASIITPQELMDLVSEASISKKPVMLVDMKVVLNLRYHELMHAEVARRLEKNEDVKGLIIQYQNLPGEENMEERVDKILRMSQDITSDYYMIIREFFLARAKDNRVTVTEEMLQEIEGIVGIGSKRLKVGIIGGLCRAGNVSLSTGLSPRRVFDEPAFSHFAVPYREGHEVSKKGRRDVVVSKKGNAYPLPKGQRGMPRVGRTRGR